MRLYSVFFVGRVSLASCHFSVEPKTRLNTARLTARLSDVHLTIYCILFDYISPHHLFVYGKDDSTHKIFSTIYELRVTISSWIFMSDVSLLFVLRKLSRLTIDSLLINGTNLCKLETTAVLYKSQIFEN